MVLLGGSLWAGAPDHIPLPTPPRAERIPWLETTVSPRLAGPAMRVRPVRLKSGAFTGAGALAENLAAVWASQPQALAAHVLVQLDRVADDPARERLQRAGLTLLGYVPEAAYFATVRRDADLAAAAAAGLRWLGAIYPEDKLSETLRAGTPGRWALEADGRVRLRLWPFEDAALPVLRAALAAAGAEVLRESPAPPELQVRVAPDRVVALAALDAVRWIEEIPPPPALYNDGLRGDLQIPELEAAPYSLTGAGVVVGIWDGGWVDAEHPDLVGRVQFGEATVPQPRNRHATHVAGTLAGTGAASASAGGQPFQWRGVAPGVSLVSYDVSTGSLVEEHRQARERFQAVISQNSWGITVSEFFSNCHLLGDYTGEAPNYDRLVRGLDGAPFHVIFAAGNARTRNTSNDCPAPEGYRTVGVPATAKNVIAVGAIHSDDHSMTAFSGWGPTDDGRLKPEVVAPGDELGGDGGITSTVPDGPYGVLVGTSMAAPAVSGATALLIEDYRHHFNGQTPPPALVKGLLVHTAEDLDDATDWFQPGPDYASGYGRVRVRAAVDHLRAGGWLLGQVSAGQDAVYTFTVPPEATQVKLTLVWDDVAALQNAAITLVNDLDLVVLDPTGARHYPWTLDPAQPSLPARRDQPDHLNNLEQVRVDQGLVPGAWQVQVVAHTLPLGAAQKFALLFTPLGMPSAPLLSLEAGAPDDNAGGNGNGVPDPGEEIEEWLVLHNLEGPAATNLTVRLHSSSPWVKLLQTGAACPDIPPGGSGTNLTRLAYRLSKQTPCGEVLHFEHVTALDGVRLTNHFQRVVGRLEVTNVATAIFASADTPLPLPDVATSVSTLPVALAGTVLEVRTALRLDHTWLDDLDIRLRAPDGGTTLLIPALRFFGQNLGRGECGSAVEWTRFDDAADAPMPPAGAPYVGTFRPFEPLAGLTNRPLAGNWQLVLTDTSAEDVGTLLCWELEVRYAQAGHVCDPFNRPPRAPDLSRSVWFEHPLDLQLEAADPDEDPLTWQLLDPPRHGTLSDFDPATGRVRYTPEPGYSGPDAFTFVVADGYGASATGTMNLEVQPPSVDLTVLAVLEPPRPRHDLPFTLELVVTNRGPNDAAAVMLTAQLPEDWEVLDLAASQGSASVQRRVLVAPVGAVPEAGRASVLLTLRAAAAGTFLLQATASTVTRELNFADNLITPDLEVLPTADLVLGAAPVPSPVPAGAPWVVQWTLTNLGPYPASAVRLTAPWPPETELIAAQLSQGSATLEAGQWLAELGTLEVGAAATIELTVATTRPGPWTLTLEAAGAEPDPVPDNHRVEVSTEVRPVTDLLALWSVEPGPRALGAAFTQTLLLTNRSAVPATALVADIVTDLALSAREALPTRGTASLEPPTVRWAVDTLAPGEAVRLDVVLEAAATGFLTNRATVSAFEFDAAPDDNAAEAAVEIRPVADLVLAFEPPAGRAVLGLPARYTLTVSNAGPATARAVELVHPVPAGLTPRELEAGSGTAELEAGRIIFRPDPLEAGAVATLHVDWVAETPGEIAGRAEVAAFEVDPQPADNATHWVLQVEPPADLALALALDPPLVLLSRDARLTWTATNTSAFPAPEARVVLTLPEGLEVGATDVSQGGVEALPDGRMLFALGELPAGAAATGQVQLLTTRPGEFELHADLAAAPPDLEPANNSAAATLTVAPAVDLHLAAEAPGPWLAGRESAVALTVSNRGPLTATGVRFRASLPEAWELAGVEGLEDGCTLEGTGLQCTLEDLPAGASQALRLLLRPPAPEPFDLEFSVQADPADLEPADNLAPLAVQVEGEADLALECPAPPTPPLVGQAVTLAVRLFNHGPYPAAGVVLHAQLPADASLLAVRPEPLPWEVHEATVSVNVGELAVATAAEVEFEVRFGQVGPRAVPFTLSAATPDLLPENDACTLALEVLPAANLGLSVQSLPEPTSPGWLTRLLVTVTNRGPEIARQVVVTGTPPATLEFQGVTFDLGLWQPGPEGWTWTLEEVPPGTAAELETEWLPTTPGTWTHAVTVSAQEPDPDPADNAIAAPITVRLVADLSLRGEAPPAPVRREVPTHYTLHLENRGPESATAVEVVHHFPDTFHLDAVTSAPGEVVTEAGRVVWRPGDLVPEAVARLDLTVTPQQSGAFALTAEVLSDQNDPTAEDRRLALPVTVLDRADLAVFLSVTPGAPLWNQDVVLELLVTNRGPHTATAVALRQPPPLGFELRDRDIQPPPEPETVEGDWLLVWEELAPGAAAVVRWQGRFLQAGAVPLIATVSAQSLDEAPEDNAAALTLEVAPAADLRLAKEALDPLARRDLPLRYRLAISNAGLLPATAVRLTDPLPPGTELLDLQPDRGEARLEEGEVVFEPGDLAPGDAAALELALRPLAAGTLTNLATVTMAEPDPRPEDNTAAAVSEVVLAADLAAAFETPPSPVALGAPFTVSFNVTNAGPHPATAVVATGSLPAGAGQVEILASQGDVRTQENTWTATLGELAPAATATVSFTFLPETEGALALEGSVHAAELDPEPANNAARAAVEARPVADLQLVLLSDAEQLVVGRELGLLLAVTNQGPHAATGVTIHYQLPPDTELTRLEPTAGTWTSTPTGFTATFDSLPAGAVVGAEFAVRTTRPGPAAHQAEVAAATFDPTPDNNRALLQTEVFVEADLLVWHAPLPPALLLSNQYVVTVVVTNRGTIPAQRVQMLVAFSLNVDLLEAEFIGGDAVLAPPGVVCEMGTMAPGSSVVLHVLTRPNRADTFVCQAAVRSPAADPDNPALLSRLEVPVFDRPHLFSRREGNRLMLTWPALAADFDLEFTTDPGGGTWEPVPNPKLIVGDEVQIHVKLSAPQVFYRLRKAGP